VGRDALARQAVLVGARGFLVQPLDPEEVHKALAESLSRGRAPVLAEGIETRPSAEGKVVAFCAPKGGTGRTTLAVNTALSLRGVTGQSVVLVDADYAAPALDVALDLKHTRDVADLVSRIARLDEALVDGVLGEHASGVKVLLAPPPTRGAPPVGPAHVQQIVAILRRMFDWVVVDVGLPHDAAAYGYLGLADRVVLNVLPEMIGLRNTQNLLARLQSKGIARERIWVVVNRATLRGGLPLVDIQGRMAIDVAFQIPDDQPAATESVNRGIPLVVDRRYTALAKAMRALAKRLAEDLTNPQPPAGFVAVETGRTGPGRTLRWPWVGLWAGMGLGAVAAAVVLGVPRLPALRAALGGAQTPTTAAVAQGDTHLIVAPSAAPQETLEPSPPPATSTATHTATSAPTEPAAAAAATDAPAAPALAETPSGAPAGPTETEASPTDSAEPTATATASPTETASPTATTTPTATLTPTSTASPTASLEPSETPLPLATTVYPAGWYAPVALLSPENRQVFGPGDPLVLRWESSGNLQPGVFYVVTLAYTYGGRTVYDDVPWVTDTHWDVTEHEYLRDIAEGGRFFWSVTLKRRTGFDADGRPAGTDISPLSEVRSFVWLRDASGG